MSSERQKSTSYELKVVDQENQIEDLKRQLTVVKKREDMLKQNIQELTYELEKVRENDMNNSFMSGGSFQQTMIQELELKIQSLTSQNEILKTGNQEIINQKYIELETEANSEKSKAS